jgi:O-antigen ligase
MPAPPASILDLLVFAACFTAVAFATQRKPVLAVVALIALDPFAFYRSAGMTTLTLSKVALLGALAGLLLRHSSFREPWTGRGMKLLLAVALVAAAVGLSAWHADARLPVLREVLKWIEYGAILTVCGVAFCADRDEALVRWATLLTTAAVIALAIPELFVGASSGTIIGGIEVPRIAGPLEGPNQLAAYLGLTLPLILAYTLQQGRRWPEVFTIAAGIVATVLSISRAGIVALLLALFFVVILSASSRAVRSIFTAGAVALLIAASAGWRLVAGGIGLVTAGAHHHVEVRGGLGTRRELWAAAAELWRQHPFWGIGAGNYELEVGKLLHAPIRTHTNSFYLQSLVEGGIPLLAATVFLIYSSIATFVRSERTPLTIAAVAASAALSLHFVLDLLVFYPKVGMQWMIVLGLAAADLAIFRHRSPS